MTAIQFYHLTASPLERALPRLLEKCYLGGFRTLVAAGSDEQAERLNQLLWTYDPDSFLPHGTAADGHTEQQPILLASSISEGEFPILLVTDGTVPDDTARFERILDLFDGRNPESVEKARQRWTLYKNAGHDLSYLQQSDSGSWKKAASNG